MGGKGGAATYDENAVLWAIVRLSAGREPVPRDNKQSVASIIRKPARKLALGQRSSSSKPT